MGCGLVNIDFEIACCYGRLTADFSKRKLLSGRSQNDLWIAATAVALKAVLLTRHAGNFESIPGLQVEAYGI